jgi:hypothetical protein
MPSPAWYEVLKRHSIEEIEQASLGMGFRSI